MEKVKVIPNKGLLKVILVGVIIFVVIIGALKGIQPPSVIKDPGLDEFSVERAMKHIEIIAQRPHPIGSEENRRVRDYIVEELEELGLEPQMQRTIAVQEDFMVAGNVENILARLEGTDSTSTILIVSHYDSVSTGPGASDDGTAVATMLETLRALKSGNALKNDIIFLFTDGEERGLMGAQAFVDKHPWAKDIDLVLNLEARGSSGPSFMFETSNDNFSLIKHFSKAAPYPVTNSVMYEIYKLLPNGSDLTVFKKAGYSGLNFAYMSNVNHYHRQLDNINNVDKRSLQHHGLYVLPLLKYFGDMDLNAIKAEENAIYFSILGRNIISYPQSWVTPISVFLLICFVGLIVYGLRNKVLSIKGIVAGGLSLGLIIVIVTLILQVIWKVFVALNIEITWITEFSYYNDKILISYFIFATIITLLIYRIFRNKVKGIDLFVGVLTWWSTLGIVTSILIPGMSYLFIWPWALGILMLGIFIKCSTKTFLDDNNYLVGLVPLLSGTIIILPVICVIPVAMGLGIGSFTMVLYVLLLGLLAPFINLRGKKQSLIFGVSLLTGILLIIQTLATAGFTEANPKTNHLMFVQNLDTNEAFWVSADSEPDAWTGQFISSNEQKSFMKEVNPFRDHEYIIERTDVANLPNPTLSLVNEKVFNDTRTLILNLKSSKEDSVVRLFVEDTKEIIKQIEIDGKKLPIYEKLSLGLVALPKEGIDIKFVLSKNNNLDIRVVEQNFGFPKEIIGKYQERPKNMIPEGFDDSDSTFTSIMVSY